MEESLGTQVIDENMPDSGLMVAIVDKAEHVGKLKMQKVVLNVISRHGASSLMEMRLAMQIIEGMEEELK